MNQRPKKAWPGNNPYHGHSSRGHVKKMGDEVELLRTGSISCRARED